MLMPLVSRAVCIALLVAGAVVPAFAQGPGGARPGDDAFKTATRLGGPSRFYGPVRDRAALQRMMRNRRAQQGLHEVLEAAGLGSVSGQVAQILTDATPTQVTEIDFPVGGTIAWMALRRNGRAGVVRAIRWGGRRPFKAFQFTIDDMKVKP